MVILGLEIGEFAANSVEIDQVVFSPYRSTDICKTKFIELRDISTNYQYSISHCTFFFFTNIQSKIVYLKLLKIILYRGWKVKIISWFKKYLQKFV